MAPLYVPYYFFLHLCQLSNNKGVYPTPYEFSLVTFSDFLRCYIFICKVADHAASEAQEVFVKWKTTKGREKLERMARMASEHPWRPNALATAAASNKPVHSGDGTLQEGIEPMMEYLELFEKETGIVAGMEDDRDGHSSLLTRANLKTTNSDKAAKHIRNWVQSLFEIPTTTTRM